MFAESYVMQYLISRNILDFYIPLLLKNNLFVHFGKTFSLWCRLVSNGLYDAMQEIEINCHPFRGDYFTNCKNMIEIAVAIYIFDKSLFLYIMMESGISKKFYTNSSDIRINVIVVEMQKKSFIHLINCALPKRVDTWVFAPLHLIKWHAQNVSCRIRNVFQTRFINISLALYFSWKNIEYALFTKS